MQLQWKSVVFNPKIIHLADVQLDIHREIIEKAMDKNPLAQKQLYQLYGKAMFNICCRMMGHRSDAEDMLQEVFVEAFNKLQTFRFESTFGAWMKRITINKCINELKRRRVQLEYSDQTTKYDREAEEDAPPDQLELDAEKIKHAMGLLPDGYRVVFSLYLLEGYDHEEIASILGITESTSKTQLMRAKKKVVEILSAGQMLRSNVSKN
jgi:RNA polymerase sigma factor (sigma-70 family)